MLWCVYGCPGTGKTLFAIKDYLIPALQRGRSVATNITGLSVAGISSVGNIPPNQVVIFKVTTIPEVINLFDTEGFRNCVFILDEVRSLVNDDDKSSKWLSKRIDLMRKRDIDFIIIAQVPSYLDEEIRENAEGCSYFKRAYSLGFSKKTIEYRFNNGTPRIVSGKPISDGTHMRQLDPEIFTCYQSYVDNQIKGESTDRNKVTKVWASNSAQKVYISIGLALFLTIGGFFFLRSFLGMGVNTTKKVADNFSGRQQLKVIDSTQINKDVKNEDENCYRWIICTSEYCKTDKGFASLSQYDADNSVIIIGGRPMPRCEDNRL